MPKTTTPFDPKRHHIHFQAYVTHLGRGTRHKVACILDTGAARTEFSDWFLFQLGFIESFDSNVELKKDHQTQKYAKFVLPSFEICEQRLPDFEVMVSKFHPSWGIDALVGLDFFRRFRTTIDYENARITTEPIGAHG